MPVPVDTLPSATLIWDGGQLPACDRSTALRQNVSVYLGRDPFEADARLTIRVRVRRAPENATLIADVSETDEQGQVLGVRSVRAGASCETLDEPLTLVVALMLDTPPSAPEPPREAAALPPEPNELPTDPEAGDSFEPEPGSGVSAEAPEVVQPAHAFLSAGLDTTFGRLPFPAFGARLQAVFKPRRFWGLELSGGAWPFAHVDLPSSGRIDFRLFELGAALCPVESLRDDRLLRVCGGMTVGWLRAESHDLQPNHRRTEVVLSPELHLQVGQSIGKGFILGGGVAAALALGPNQYTYRNPDGVRQVAFKMAVPALNLGLFVARELP